MKNRWQVLWVSWAVLSAPVIWAAATGPMPEANASVSNEGRGRAAYNAALQLLKKADALTGTAAQDAYKRARKQFQEATTWAPELAEAWNGVGYTQRKLGSHIAALAAYEQALRLKPGYPEAIEYRGEAFLGLNRIDDAKQAYLELFAAHRGLSDLLLESMRGWIQSRRETPEGVDVAAINELEAWVQERSRIATQTAALTRTGASSPRW